MSISIHIQVIYKNVTLNRFTKLQLTWNKILTQRRWSRCHQLPKIPRNVPILKQGVIYWKVNIPIQHLATRPRIIIYMWTILMSTFYKLCNFSMPNGLLDNEWAHNRWWVDRSICIFLGEMRERLQQPNWLQIVWA